MKQRLIVILILIQLLFSCNRKIQEDKLITLRPKLTKHEKPTKPYSNPVLIYGSSFGEYFQSLWRNGKYETMLHYTSNITISKFGKQRIVNYYKREFRFDYCLGKLSNISTSNNIMYLIYANTTQFATRKKIVIECLIENDTSKLLLSELDSSPFY